MNKNDNFVGEGLIREEYERLRSIDPNNPILNYGITNEEKHFQFNASFYEYRRIQYREQPTSNDKIYYNLQLRNTIRSLGGKTVMEERNEREKEMLGVFSPESNLDHIVVDENF